MAETALAKKGYATIRDFFQDNRAQLAEAVPRYADADQMLRVALTSIRRSATLQACSPASLMAAVIEAGQLGLITDGTLGEAYLVPFKGEATLIVGYKGLIRLADQSGVVVVDDAVFDGDEFTHHRTLEKDHLHHARSKEAKTDQPVIFAYAIARYKDGSPAKYEVLSRQQIDKIRKGAAGQNSQAWTDHFPQMARKTAVRRLLQKVALRSDLGLVVAREEEGVVTGERLRTSILEGSIMPVPSGDVAIVEASSA